MKHLPDDTGISPYHKFILIGARALAFAHDPRNVPRDIAEGLKYLPSSVLGEVAENYMQVRDFLERSEYRRSYI